MSQLPFFVLFLFLCFPLVVLVVYENLVSELLLRIILNRLWSVYEFNCMRECVNITVDSRA